MLKKWKNEENVREQMAMAKIEKKKPADCQKIANFKKNAFAN